ncbi:MAG: integrase core domain-containing protein, partial [Phycisphaerae bacterium]
MKTPRHRAEQIVAKLRQADVELGKGLKVCATMFPVAHEHWFVSVADARAIIKQWREMYNRHRPHSALGYATPAAYAAGLRGLRSPPAPSVPAGTPAPVGA